MVRKLQFAVTRAQKMVVLGRKIMVEGTPSHSVNSLEGSGKIVTNIKSPCIARELSNCTMILFHQHYVHVQVRYKKKRLFRIGSLNQQRTEKVPLEVVFQEHRPCDLETVLYHRTATSGP